MRINARLDDEHADKLTYLLDTGHGKVTDVVKRGIDLYYDEVRRREGAGVRRLLESDFVGCAEGDEALSSRYKDELSGQLGDKHGHR
ncbi:hypothetical protein [Endothiovibrio diazotrophicus]